MSLAGPAHAYYEVDDVQAVTQGAKIQGQVGWTSPHKITIGVQVYDTSADSQCAQLYIANGNYWDWKWYRIAQACGNGAYKQYYGEYTLSGGMIGKANFGVCRAGRGADCTPTAVDNNRYGNQ